MFKQFLKMILLYFKNKRKNIKSFSKFISLNSTIGKYCNIQKDTEIDSYCKIGKYTYIGKHCYLTKVTIGNYCSIANNISIGQGEHDVSNISTSSLFYDTSCFRICILLCLYIHVYKYEKTFKYRIQYKSI